MNMKWYVVHTQTGAEEKARAGLESRIAATDLKQFIGEIVVPTEQVSEIRGGKKRITARKFFPGYILIKMEMTKESWYLIKSTPGITGFIGPGRRPTPISDEEVNSIVQRIHLIHKLRQLTAGKKIMDLIGKQPRIDQMMGG